MAFKIWVTDAATPLTEVSISACASFTASGRNGTIFVTAYSSQPVDTNVEVTYYWVGGFYSISSTIIIPAGESCVQEFRNGADDGVTADSFYTEIFPETSATQQYTAGGDTISDFCPTCF